MGKERERGGKGKGYGKEGKRKRKRKEGKEKAGKGKERQRGRVSSNGGRFRCPKKKLNMQKANWIITDPVNYDIT